MGKSSKITQFLQVFSFTLCGILTFMASVDSASREISTAIVAFLIIGVGSTIWLEIEKANKNQILILKYLTKKEGKVTLTELVLHLELSVWYTKRLVSRLENQGILTFEVSDNGEAYYRCNDIVSVQRKYMSRAI